MSDTTTKKRNRFITGAYPALWNWLLTPDTRWSEHGTYGTDLMMSINDAKQLVLLVQDEAKEQIAKMRNEQKETKDWSVAWPIKDYDGEDETYSGTKVISFRQKVNPAYHFTVDVFDAKKNQIEPGSLRIGNGTKLRVSFYVRVVKDQINKCIRVLFHPRAAQIIELVKWEADYGFDEEEGFNNGNGAPREISDMRPRQPTADDPFANDKQEFKSDDIPF